MLKLRLYCQMVGDKTMFYDKYCELCRQKGISPSAAAIEMGINKGTVSIWKSKGTTPQTAILGKIADYFGVSVDYLLGNEPKEKTPAETGERTISDEDIMFALFNGADDITDEMFEEVKRFAQFVQERERNKPT